MLPSALPASTTVPAFEHSAKVVVGNPCSHWGGSIRTWFRHGGANEANEAVLVTEVQETCGGTAS